MRSLLAPVVAILAILAIGVTGASAGQIGGTLHVTETAVMLTSNASDPVNVTITVDGSFVVVPDQFSIAPGETVQMQVVGDHPTGTVSAHLSLPVTPGVESAGVVLKAGMPKPFVPQPDYGSILLGIVGVLALLVAVIRVRPWQYRVSRHG